MRSSLFRIFRTAWPDSWVGRILASTVGWGCILVAVTGWENNKAADAPANRPLQVTDAGYVTSNDCRSCHPANYASWHASFHRTMTQVARPANIIPEMDGLQLAIDNFTYRVERRNDTYRVRKRPADAPDRAFESPREIVLTTGSHNMQFFWMETGQGRTLEHFPFGWLVEEKIWAPINDTLMSPPEYHELTAGIRAIGDWNGGCIDCHTTQGRSRREVEGRFDSQVSEFGISCEACHSEGSEHVARQRNPLRRYDAYLTKRGDRTIANPAKMSSHESALACGQCHSVWAFNSAEAGQHWNREGTKFRPGQPELPERFVVRPTSADHSQEKKNLLAANPNFYEDSFWSDGMVRVVGREFNGVEASPCFKGGAFSCLSCHEMHPEKTDGPTLAAWAPSQMKTDSKTDFACLQCHEAIKSNPSAHTHHAPESAGSRCYDCHMPHTGFGLLRAVRSHQVSSPTVDESIRIGRPNACNLCHLDQPLAWTAEKLHAWYGTPVPALSREDREIAAGVKWIVKGDAAQRALAAWSMGWEPAQKASGREWFTPYLAVSMVDSYAAVRFVVGKSLRTLPGFENLSFNYTGTRPQIKVQASQAYQQWLDRQRVSPTTFAPAVRLELDGSMQVDTYSRLLEERDQRPVFLVE